MSQNNQGANYRGQMDEIAEVLMWPTKIVQCIQVFNGEEFIEYVLKSIYNAVDHIRIVEGAVKNQVGATKDGHSTDKTVEIIKRFIKESDPGKKVRLIQIKRPYENLEEMKQTFLDYAVPGEWLLINDVDEFYREEDIHLLRRAIYYQPLASEFVPLFLHFYRDCVHIAKPEHEWQPQHQRFFRFVKGMKYNAHPIVTDHMNHCTYYAVHYQHRRFVVKDWYVWHYGYARENMDKVMMDKKTYYEKELSKHAGADKPFDEKANLFLNRGEDLGDFLSYNIALHPEVLKNHPMMKFRDEQWSGLIFDPWHKAEPYCLEEIPNIWLWMTGANPRMPFYSNQITLDELKEL